MQIVRNKARMYRMLEAGMFGNRFRIWRNTGDLLRAVDEGFDWLVGVRCVGRPGLPYYHHKTPSEAIDIGLRLSAEHRCPVRYYEASPDSFITIQGEFVEAEHGPMLEWSSARTHMRAALQIERRMAYGPEARLILQQALSAASYADFLAIGDVFHGAVIEFTAYEVFVGQLAGRNAVVWECRNY